MLSMLRTTELRCLESKTKEMKHAGLEKPAACSDPFATGDESPSRLADNSFELAPTDSLTSNTYLGAVGGLTPANPVGTTRHQSIFIIPVRHSQFQPLGIITLKSKARVSKQQRVHWTRGSSLSAWRRGG
jgi:hypothetical protein